MMRTACLAVAVVSVRVAPNLEFSEYKESSSLQLVFLAAVEGYHTPVSELTRHPHCWPLDADDENDETIDCGGES